MKNPEIVKMLVDVRKGAGLTQKEMATELNVAQSHLSMMESGRYAISADILRKAGEACGYNLVFVKSTDAT